MRFYHGERCWCGDFVVMPNHVHWLVLPLPGQELERILHSIKGSTSTRLTKLGLKEPGRFWRKENYDHIVRDEAELRPSPGGANTNPPGDVVISEVMFNPPGGEDALLEYVVLHNPTTTPISFLADAGNWRLLGGVTYVFAGRMGLVAGDYFILVPFAPAGQERKDDFMAAYGLTGQSVFMVGPYEGRLANGQGRLRLQRPQAPDFPGEPVSWVTVDEVTYSSYQPWFDSADGTGLALHRRDVAWPGADTAAWQTGYPSPLTGEIQWPRPVLLIEPQPTGVRISWDGSLGFTYELQRRASLLSASWQTVHEVTTNGGAHVADTYLDRGAAYRVRQKE